MKGFIEVHHALLSSAPELGSSPITINVADIKKVRRKALFSGRAIAVIDVKASNSVCVTEGYEEVERLIEQAQEDRKTGRWFGTVCSACGESTSFYYDCEFCPHCGAEMEGEL